MDDEAYYTVNRKYGTTKVSRLPFLNINVWCLS